MDGGTVRGMQLMYCQHDLMDVNCNSCFQCEKNHSYLCTMMKGNILRELTQVSIMHGSFQQRSSTLVEAVNLPPCIIRWEGATMNGRTRAL